jgi:hypothetical protein
MEYLILIKHLLSDPVFGKCVALSAIGLVIVVLYVLHHDHTNPIRFEDLFINEKTGKLGGSEFRVNIAFIATTWVLIFLTIKGSLSEWYVVAYLTAFVADRALSRNSTTKDIPNVNQQKISPARTDPNRDIPANTKDEVQ